MSKFFLHSKVDSLFYDFRRDKKNQVSNEPKLSQVKTAIPIPCTIP